MEYFLFLEKRWKFSSFFMKKYYEYPSGSPFKGYHIGTNMFLSFLKKCRRDILGALTKKNRNIASICCVDLIFD